jgi:hypothetical protein
MMSRTKSGGRPEHSARITDSERKANYRDRANLIHISIGMLSAVCGILSLWFQWDRVSQLVAVFADVYVVGLLLVVAIRSDGFASVDKLLPHRLFGLLLFLLLPVALIPSFADLYISRGDVCQAGSQHCLTACSPSQETAEATTKASDCQRATRINALYFSFVTMTTLGYGDFVPGSEGTRGIVMWQLVSGVLLFILAFPMVISRMAVW